MSSSPVGSLRRRIGAVALVALAAGTGAACRNGGEGSSTPNTTVNQTGAGTAVLDLAGSQTRFDIVCESTEPGGGGTLMISGTGTDTSSGTGTGTGTAVAATPALQVQVDVASGTAMVGANVTGKPSDLVQAAPATASVDVDRLVVSGSFVEVASGKELGEGSVIVEGCTPR